MHITLSMLKGLPENHQRTAHLPHTTYQLNNRPSITYHRPTDHRPNDYRPVRNFKTKQKLNSYLTHDFKPMTLNKGHVHIISYRFLFRFAKLYGMM